MAQREPMQIDTIHVDVTDNGYFDIENFRGGVYFQEARISTVWEDGAMRGGMSVILPMHLILPDGEKIYIRPGKGFEVPPDYQGGTVRVKWFGWDREFTYRTSYPQAKPGASGGGQHDLAVLTHYRPHEVSFTGYDASL